MFLVCSENLGHQGVLVIVLWISTE